MATAAVTTQQQASSSPLSQKLVASRYWVIAALALVAPLIAVLQLGRIHPDEVFQTLEPAYWRVHGYGILAWEWQPQGAIRNWITPSVFVPFLWLAKVLGIDHPQIYRALCEIPVLALNGWMLLSVYRFAERRVGPARALFAPALVGLYAVALTFAGRTMGESFSAALIVIAFEALDRPLEGGARALRRAGLVAGLTLGFAVVTRYGSAVMVVVALVHLLARRDWTRLTFTVISGAAVLALLAAVDTATWGKPLHSMLAYLDFNVFSGRAAAQFGADPWHMYLPIVAGALPVWAWPGLFGALWLQRPRVPLALVAAVVYVAVISGTAHKEARFLYPALIFVLFVAAPGLIALCGKLKSPRVAVGALFVALAAGFFPPHRPVELTAQRPEQFRATVKASRDATGLILCNDGMWGTGGYFYLGKAIPWTMVDFAQDPRFQGAMGDRRINRAITFDHHLLQDLLAAGFQIDQEMGPTTLLIRK